MSEQKKSNKKLIAIICAVLVVLIAVFAVVYHFYGPGGTEGEKKITVQIVFAQGDEKTVEIKTKSEFLRGALEEENLIAGEESLYGLYVKTVDGVTVDDAAQEWWCFTKNGESLSTGVDSTPIEDGDKFEITLKVGY